MQWQRYISATAAIGIAMGAACKKPYTPNIPDTGINVLIVEGHISNAPDPSKFKITRTVSLTDGRTTKPELSAVLTIEDEENSVVTLTEAGNGVYTAPAIVLNSAKKYRLRIKTADGKVYLSAAEQVKNAPVIDSVGFTTSATALTIYANTHDPANATRYYRWDYEDAWHYRSQYDSYYETDGTQIVNRRQHVYNCYAEGISSSVMLYTNNSLSKDEVYRAPVAVIPAESEKIGIRYSILVKQYALTPKAYEFWSNIKRNTEQLGSIFDVLPSAPIGNITCLSDPSVPVLGYVSAGGTQTKRIFIDRSQLPANWTIHYEFRCQLDSTPFVKDSRYPVNEILVPLERYKIPVDQMIVNGAVMGYMASDPHCVDCTLRGGKLTPPPFWR